MTKVRLPSPLIGDRSEPVQKKRRRLRSAADMSCTISQKARITGWSRVYPSSVHVTSSSAWKSSDGLPQMSSSSSSGTNMRSAGPPHTSWKPCANAPNCCSTDPWRSQSTYSRTYSARFSLVTTSLSPPGFSAWLRIRPNSSYSATKVRCPRISVTSPSSASSWRRPRARAGLASSRSASVPVSPISLRYTTMGKWTSRMTLL
mmetsp:Transcript_24574/g.51363  ORF Transcript_24574/g.51363 Transcript_24574/m.51363 type:complete len:203 (-) Transcript_24574:202-810(-)